MARTWFITDVSNGLGRELTTQLLDHGEQVIGTARHLDAVADLAAGYPDTFRAEQLDVTDVPAIRAAVYQAFDGEAFEGGDAFDDGGRVDVVVSNAGYGLFGAAEELTDAEINDIIATNLVGPIQLIRAVLPLLRVQGGGRIIQISSYGGQVAFPGNSMYHATKWGIEGFVESVAPEVAPFGVGMTLVEPGGARTEFRHGSARVADPMPTYAGNPAHGFEAMLDPAAPPAPGDPARMAARIIESADIDPAPLRLMLGSQALERTTSALHHRIEGYEGQAGLAASTDFPPGE